MPQLFEGEPMEDWRIQADWEDRRSAALRAWHEQVTDHEWRRSDHVDHLILGNPSDGEVFEAVYATDICRCGATRTVRLI